MRSICEKFLGFQVISTIFDFFGHRRKRKVYSLLSFFPFRILHSLLIPRAFYENWELFGVAKINTYGAANEALLNDVER